jgi:ferredoxin
LEEAMAAWDVYAPQKHWDADVWLERLPKDKVLLDKALDNVILDGADTLISPKDIFFPQLESIFEFKDGGIREAIESSPKLLFGVKACDLKGILFVDDFYKRNFEDIYYLSRIKNRFIIVIGCLNPPRPTCFCSSAKTGPFAKEGYDLQFTAKGDVYFVEIGSSQGEKFITKYVKYFKDAEKNAGETVSEIKSKASDAVELKVDFRKALELMAKDDFVPEESYKSIGERCVYCGGCLYVCPTCTCFNVFDNTKNQDGERLRNWDACVFEGYTRETSGHNPRKEKWLRTSRRYEHKLKYDYKATGTSGCVGCGRCLASCPVDIGISKFIEEITEKKRIM